MKPDDFEKQLQRQPLRAVPASWRSEILREASLRKAESVRARVMALRESKAWWREWLWPCPEAWAGLAAVWMLILGLNMTGSQTSQSMAAKSPLTESVPSSLFAEQRRELARLLEGTIDPTPMVKPAQVPGPRSERSSPLRT